MPRYDLWWVLLGRSERWVKPVLKMTRPAGCLRVVLDN
jgi:hypothetical protein